ncbi:MAG TPA: hydrogenase maturation protease [Oryzihumus sp.]|nr:hydrogenase maturation protease [Oryzihumus sp.]
MNRVLVAGVGNIFRGDDGFGSAVMGRLAGHVWPEGVTAKDFGIGGIHLAYELVDGWDGLVLVDAVDRSAEPGTLFVIEPDLAAAEAAPVSMLDAHDLAPQAVLAMVPRLGGRLGRVRVLGCQPASLDDGLGLSAPVTAVLDAAAALVLRLVDEAVRAPVEGAAPVGAPVGAGPGGPDREAPERRR